MSRYRSKLERVLEQLLDSPDDTIKLKAALALDRIAGRAERKKKQRKEQAAREKFEILSNS